MDVMLANATIAELLALEAERAGHRLERAYRRVSRKALLWEIEASDLVRSARPLTYRRTNSSLDGRRAFRDFGSFANSSNPSKSRPSTGTLALTFFMLLRYDLFKIESSGKLSWLGPVKDIAAAKRRVEKLPPSPKGYCVIDQDTGIRTKIKVDFKT